MKKTTIIISVLTILLLFTFQVQSATFRPDMLYSKWIIDSRMGDFRNKTVTNGFITPTNPTRTAPWDYVPGLVAKAILKAYEQYKTDPGCAYYFTGIQDYATIFDPLTSLGTSDIDKLNAGKIFFELYRGTKVSDPAKAATYKSHATTCRNTLKEDHYRINSSLPGTGGFWHKSQYTNQMWLDGLYMGPALYAEWQGNFGLENGIDDNTASWEDIALQFDIIFSKTWDTGKKLNYHAWSAEPLNAASKYWADPVTGRSKEFWGRSMGWFFAALVDVLEYMPTSASRTRLVGYANSVADGLKARQDATSGCWYQLLQWNASTIGDCTGTDKPNYLESSASSMFTYAYFKGVRLGILNATTYLPVANKAYQGLISNFVVEESTSLPTTIKLIKCCQSASVGVDKLGDINYYLCASDAIINNETEGKVLGSFIMASLEYERATYGVTFTTQPIDKTVCINNAITLGTVVAENATTYQWYSNTSKTNTGGTSVGAANGGNTATYSPSTSTAGTKYYYCVANNNYFSATSDAVQVTVNPATAITAQSTNTATYIQNATASALSVTATGISLSYQWYSSNDASTSTTGDDVTVGSNSNSYTPSTATAGTKYYYCKVTGTCSIVTSAVSGAITITPPCTAPVFTTQPIDNQSECIGGALTFGLLTTDLSSTFQWYSNTSKTNYGGTMVPSGGFAPTFTPPSTTPGTYYYYCVALSSGCAGASNAVQITIHPATAITAQSTDAASYVLNFASPTALTVTATGTGLSYQWYSSTDQSNSTLGDDVIVGTNSNSFTPPTSAISTKYFYCVVTGGCAPTTVKSAISGAIIITTPAPTITLTSGSATQSLKVNNAITNIVYTLTNATGATVTGLPTGLSGNYSNGTFTISGTIGAAVTPATYNFTVTAAALAGYVGSNITSTGTITVQQNIINILYLTATSTLSANDTKLYPMLIANASYNLTKRAVFSTTQTATAYSAYDLIIINEDIQSTNLEIIGLKTIDKPILSIKSFLYNSGNSRWDWGNASDGYNRNGEVKVKQPSHPIFNGIAFTNGALILLNDAADKCIQPVELSNMDGIVVANALFSANYYAVAIHDVPASERSVVNSKFLMIGISIASYDKMTDNTLKLFENAIDYLVNGTQFVPEPLYFRTAATGTWSDKLTWQTSYDNINWTQDVITPTPNNTKGLNIGNTNNYTLSENYNTETLTLNSGSTLNVPAAKQLTVTSSMTNNGGTLNLLSDATGTATIITPETISGTGTVNVNQYLTTAVNGRNWYISSPVSGATSNVVKSKAGSQLLSYTEANTGTATWNTITATNVPLNLMQGYVAQLASNGTITFSGPLNTGTKSITGLTRSGVVSKGFNLVGNPYPSYVNWTDAIKTNLSNTIWYRSKSTGSYLFQTYNATGAGIGANGGTTLIPPMQAFWVNVTSGTGSLEFQNGMRSHQDQSIATNRLKAPSASSQKLLRLQVSNEINSDETVIYFNNNASDNFDEYDSPKMTNNISNVPELYTQVGNERLAINGLNSIEANNVMPLGFFTLSSNTFSIKATELQNFDNDTRIILKDNVLNAEHDITNGESYQFYSETFNNSSRFSIIFRSNNNNTGIKNTVNEDISMLVYKNQNNRIIIQCNENKKGIVTVTNIYGQSLFTVPVTGTTTRIEKSFGSGIYFVTLTENGSRITKKVIID